MDCGIPFCHARRLPGEEPHSRVQRPGLPRPLARGGREPALDEQLSRRSPAASAPRRARPPARWPSTTRPVNIKHIEYQIAERAFAEGWVAAAAAEGEDRQARGRRRLRAGRPGRRAAVGPRGPRSRRLREGRPPRRAAALRHSRLQAGKAHPRPPPGADGRRGREVRAERRRRRRRLRPPTCADGSTPIVLVHGRGPAAASCACPAPIWRASTSPWTSCRSRTAAWPATRSLDGGRPAIHAKDKHVIVIGGGDTGSDCVGTAIRQGALSVTQLEILPQPPEGTNPETPWPFWPKIMRTSSVAGGRLPAPLERADQGT